MRRAMKVLVVVWAGVILWGKGSYAAAPVPTLRFGTLGVVQALPIFVGAEKGFFTEQGIRVELIPFNSAMEKDVALSAGQIAGYFGDIMTPLVLNANGTPVKMVATIFNTTGAQRMFAILTPPNAPYRTLHQLAKDGIALSSNTIVEYITTKIFEDQKIPADQINLVEIKNIAIRLQILLSGQVSGAVLPEPLVTLAELKGARVVADDAGKGASATVLAFRDRFLAESPKTVRSFLIAVSQAVSLIDKNPEGIRPIMNRYCQIPEALHQKYTIPRFPKLILPDAAQVMDVHRWLRRKEIVKAEMNYGQMVADGYLP